MPTAIASKQTPSAVLPEQVRDYARKVQNDPKLATDFLQRAGIINKAKKLTPAYR